MGIHPTIGAIEGFANANCAKFGFEEVHKLSSGFFIFHFNSDEERDQMLTVRPWIFLQRRMIIKSWTPDPRIEQKGEEKVPIWVKIPNLSLQFWNEEMLSKIGSYIGVPLIADSTSSTMERVAYARVYVEVEATIELPDFVPLTDDFGIEFHQKVYYDWIPPKCSHCKVFGHEHKDVDDEDVVETTNMLVKNFNNSLKMFNKKPYSGNGFSPATDKGNNRWKKSGKQRYYGAGQTDKPEGIQYVEDEQKEQVNNFVVFTSQIEPTAGDNLDNTNEDKEQMTKEELLEDYKLLYTKWTELTTT
ncbi:hypothetical protein LIER_16445 [Lithospermum erythrorhizon]|uniref:DUF4283 domain-containing protein n=1 Tax=Lithospermum erythrorhizon TaxID=34254 RepID=A0AAV3Q993_LITER